MARERVLLSHKDRQGDPRCHQQPEPLQIVERQSVVRVPPKRVEDERPQWHRQGHAHHLQNPAREPRGQPLRPQLEQAEEQHRDEPEDHRFDDHGEPHVDAQQQTRNSRTGECEEHAPPAQYQWQVTGL
jgi:hypothetical protein